ncbi:MAG: carboxypeptidase-like regulatory domain-containing protein [Ekhidna sp.]|uniref:carboxypeptidase-like regulatory domain-containing protein n=1 Tax=Ekhidna sp. TaxID=2608089 RepID=UPI0032EAB4BC
MRVLALFTVLFIGTSSFQPAEAQILPTKLRITVIDGLGNFVEGASVSIYETEKDYLASQNAIATLKTDKKGRVTFSDVKPISYFVEAKFEGMNNNGEGVKTSELAEGRINKVNTVIE